ncbi:hypothetical protein [Cryobacterium arcticum]|uniref:Phosphohydrolase n=1 Tax=Cryobacterium arcticum TaxID=670052 RepID=A0A318A1U5_9MICO|nr:hypothetical protein [Cryobacterium arcticum]PXA72262.1 hypothetical protein CTB96_05115 [Cryobacterium arcticum]
MADAKVPFWRRLAEAAGLTDGQLSSGIPMTPGAPPTPPSPSPASPPPSAAGPAPAAARPAPSPRAATSAAPPAQADDESLASGPGGEALLELWFARAEDDLVAWRQCLPGPSAAEIGTRLSLVPKTFLDDDVAVLRLAEHILEPEYGAAPDTSADRHAREILAVVDQARATGSSAARRAAALVLWLWASDDLHGPLSVPLRPVLRDRAMAAMAFRLAAVVDPAEWVSDAVHRDEAARTFLFWSGHLPAGEDEAAARSLLSMRDSLLQNAALAQTLADHEHRLEVTRRLQAARAREAAARYSHE